MLVEALSVLMMNTSNVSLDEYKYIAENQPKSKIEKNKNYDFSLTAKEKEYINNICQNIIEKVSLFRDYNEEVLKNNFERWEIEEASNLLSLIKYIIIENIEIITFLEKEVKLYKKYTSITNKLKQISQITKEIADFNKQYLQRAKEADEASKFMDTFLLENQEVLEALA